MKPLRKLHLLGKHKDKAGITMHQWNHIESAPTDGTKIILKIDNKNIIAYWGKLPGFYVWEWVCDEYPNGTWGKAIQWRHICD